MGSETRGMGKIGGGGQNCIQGGRGQSPSPSTITRGDKHLFSPSPSLMPLKETLPHVDSLLSSCSSTSAESCCQRAQSVVPQITAWLNHIVKELGFFPFSLSLLFMHLYGGAGQSSPIIGRILNGCGQKANN